MGDSRYSARSIQYDAEYAGQFVEQWRANSANADHPRVLDMDENTNGLTSATTAERRKQILYDVLFSGGNIEWYFGYNPQPDGGAEVFALTGESYAIYLPQATGAEILDTGRVNGRFGQRWFDPRTGQVTYDSQQLSANDALVLDSSLRTTQRLLLPVHGDDAVVPEQGNSDDAYTPDLAPGQSPPVFVAIAPHQDTDHNLIERDVTDFTTAVTEERR